jgi:hypothetical protein
MSTYWEVETDCCAKPVNLHDHMLTERLDIFLRFLITPILGLVLLAILGGIGVYTLNNKVQIIHEQRQEQTQEQQEKRHAQFQQECRLQYPHDLISQVKCYQEMLRRSI